MRRAGEHVGHSANSRGASRSRSLALFKSGLSSGSVTNAGGMGDVRDEARKVRIARDKVHLAVQLDERRAHPSPARTDAPTRPSPTARKSFASLGDRDFCGLAKLSHEPEGWERRRDLKTSARRVDFIDGNLACSELRELVVHVTFVGSSRRIKGALIELHFEHRHFCIRGMNILIVQPGEERIKTQRRPMSRSLPTLQSASPRATEGSGGVPIDRDREVQLVGFLEGSNGTRDGSVDR
ncbi:hypothetical protein EDB83DRAFT_2310607 [Lactarius deliciosus]|nr:hypothetical protein EDB83DRAFT_2310607 [Lactarius deliciosus]